MVADFPDSSVQGDHLNISDVFPAVLQKHGIGQRTFMPSVLRHQKSYGFTRVFDCFKNLVRNEFPVVFIKGIDMDIICHLRRKIRDNQSFSINSHMFQISRACCFEFARYRPLFSFAVPKCFQARMPTGMKYTHQNSSAI